MMKSMFLLILFTSFLLLSPITGQPNIDMYISSPHTITQIIYVDDSNNNGPWDGTINHPYNHIQHAIDNASPSSTILVRKGTYQDHIVIDKSLTLIGEEKNTTIIDGCNRSTVIQITHPQVELQGFTITNSGGNITNAGINCDADQTIISNCIFHHTKSGVYTKDAHHLTINHCFFYGNGDGITINRVQQATVTECMFTHNSFGLIIINSDTITIQTSDATINGIGIYLEDSTNVYIDQCALYNNNDNQGGIFLEHSEHVIVNNSNIYHNGFGILTERCSDITITHCSITYNTHSGFFIKKDSSAVMISDCEIASNLRTNIHSKFSQFTQTRCNNHDAICSIYCMSSEATVMNNWWGARLPPTPLQILPLSYAYLKQSTLTFSPWSTSKYPKAGADWTIDESRCRIPDHLNKPIRIHFNEIDSDSDGVPDYWEINNGYQPTEKELHHILDPDEDGLTNVQECYAEQWGADPFKKDVFWELDWMKTTHPDTSNKPNATLITEIKQSFANHNITLHIDTGNLGGGEQIPYNPSFSIVELRDYYWQYFLDNNISNPRKGIFHYGFLCDAGPSAGNAFFGWDNLDSFIVSADKIGDKRSDLSRDRIIIGGAIHELGHTLALTVDDHGGNDNTLATIPLTKEWITYLPYRSCMNYWYTYEIITFSDGKLGPTDFNDWEHMDLSFFKNSHFTLPDRYR